MMRTNHHYHHHQHHNGISTASITSKIIGALQYLYRKNSYSALAKSLEKISKKCSIKKCVFNSLLKTAGVSMERMIGGSEFHTAAVACKKAHSLNLVHSHGIAYLSEKMCALWDGEL